jgi:hypothetical protein
MPLVKDLQKKVNKLHYLFSYLPIFLHLCHIIIYLQLLSLMTHLGVTSTP